MVPRVCRIADYYAGCSSGHTLNMRSGTLLHVLCKTHDGSFAHVGPVIFCIALLCDIHTNQTFTPRTHVVRRCVCCAQSGKPFSRRIVRSNAFNEYRCPAATYYLCAWPAHTFALRSYIASPGPAQFLAIWPIWPQS